MSGVLHELGHGLGFLTLVDVETGSKFLGANDVFVLHLADRGEINKAYADVTDAERVTASQSGNNSVWTVPVVNANASVLSGQHETTREVLMYGPSAQKLGSSVSHFDTSLFPHELVEPSATVPLLDVGLTDDLFADLGWTLNTSSLGSNDHCAVSGTCGAGEGDCDGDQECQTGLMCVHDIGANCGFRSIVDVCESVSTGSGLGSNDYCAVNGPCGEGEGNCDNDQECQAALVCVHDVGTNYDFRAIVDVCEVT